MERSVTGYYEQLRPVLYAECSELTYIIVTILHQECHPLSVHVRVTGCLAQLVPGFSDILEQTTVRKSSSRCTMYDRSALRIMARNSLKDW